MSKQILGIYYEFLARQSYISFFEEIELFIMSKQRPNSNVELSLFDQHGFLQIFLKDETSLLVSYQFISQQFSTLFNSIEQFDASTSIQIAWLQQPKTFLSVNITDHWTNIRALFFDIAHILEMKKRLQSSNQILVQYFYFLFLSTILNLIIFIPVPYVFNRPIFDCLPFVILLGRIQRNLKVTDSRNSIVYFTESSMSIIAIFSLLSLLFVTLVLDLRLVCLQVEAFPVKLYEFLHFGLYGVYVSKVQDKRYWHHFIHIFFILFTMNLQILMQISLIADGLVVGQMIEDLFIRRTAVLILGPGLFPFKMEYGVIQIANIILVGYHPYLLDKIFSISSQLFPLPNMQQCEPSTIWQGMVFLDVFLRVMILDLAMMGVQVERESLREWDSQVSMLEALSMIFLRLKVLVLMFLFSTSLESPTMQTGFFYDLNATRSQTLIIGFFRIFKNGMSLF